MMYALCLSLYVALVVVAVVRASRPGELLAGTVGRFFEAWLIYRPRWLNDKASGNCVFCAAFWMLGMPVAVTAAVFSPVGVWALGMPWIIGITIEKLTTR